nr:hypothetical protein [Tanacetum cinerariifolium]
MVVLVVKAAVVRRSWRAWRCGYCRGSSGDDVAVMMMWWFGDSGVVLLWRCGVRPEGGRKAGAVLGKTKKLSGMSFYIKLL